MAKIKGTYFLNTTKALKALREAAERELPSNHLHYLEKPILTSGWYSEEDHLELLKALSRCLSLGETDPFTYLGQIAAERDMTGTYKAHLKPGDPATSFKRLALVWSLGHDTGDIEVAVPSPGRGRLDLHDFGVVSAELCRVHGAFFRAVPDLAGAANVEIHHLLCRAQGDDFCRWEVTWQDSG